MNKFAEAWKVHQKRVFTENGGVTFDTSGSANVDLFFMVGAMRTAPVERLYEVFGKAFGENPYIATRILLWARDVRGGAGERRVFRELLQWLEQRDTDVLELVLPKIPELGRWDDVLVFKTDRFKRAAYDMVDAALRACNGLCAKWMPRRGAIAEELRKHFGLTPKQYRKVLVKLTNVVESQMCSNDWSKINYEQVPSLAQSRYAKAFKRHDEERYSTFGKKAKEYAEYVASVATAGIETRDLVLKDEVPEKVKINAGAVFPYDVLKPLISNGYGYSRNLQDTALDTIRAQWLTLPNYMGEKNILPIVDVSGSMSGHALGNSLTAMDAAVSIGLYMATKNRGDFHNMFMTFSDKPDLVSLKGDDIVSHVEQLQNANWNMSTNLSAAFETLLYFAKANNVPQADMPEYLVILSDMEFNAAARGQTAYEDFKSKFAESGYRTPSIVWWNIASRQKNVPVERNAQGAALVSGFSPTIVKNLLSGDELSPTAMMMKTIMNPRYDLDLIKKAA
jgi:hypothetical protein